MRSGPDRNPLAGELPALLARYGADTPIGRKLRSGDAKVLLRKMESAEATIRAQEQLNRRIEDRLQRMTADHELNMQYLLQFGVSAVERLRFQQTLGEVALHGGLTVREAATLAHARWMVDVQSSNGVGVADSSPNAGNSG